MVVGVASWTFLFSIPRSAWECPLGRSASSGGEPNNTRRRASKKAFPRRAWEREEPTSYHRTTISNIQKFRDGGHLAESSSLDPGASHANRHWRIHARIEHVCPAGCGPPEVPRREL